MVTVAMMTRLNMALVWKSFRIETNCSLNVFQAVCSRSSGNSSAIVRFSNSDWALISRNSISTSSWSADMPRRLARTLRASSSWPWWISQRGENGMKIMPTKRTTANPSCRHVGISQAASDCASPEPPMKLVPLILLGGVLPGETNEEGSY
jgi:hypothetical protein